MIRVVRRRVCLSDLVLCLFGTGYLEDVHDQLPLQQQLDVTVRPTNEHNEYFDVTVSWEEQDSP